MSASVTGGVSQGFPPGRRESCVTRRVRCRYGRETGCDGRAALDPDQRHERQQVISLLTTAYTDGRLTSDELSERSGRAWAAVTATTSRCSSPTCRRGSGPVAPAPGAVAGSGALAAVLRPALRWLPRPRLPGAVPVPGGYPQRPPTARSFVGIMSASRAKGRWQVPPEVSAVAFWGASIIDLREAVFPWPEVTIKAFALMGGVDIIVPPGMDVDLPASC